MTKSYLLLIPDDEAAWAAKSDPERETVFAQHRAFRTALEERGIRVLLTHELAHSREGRVVSSVDGATRVAEGPYAESAEQITGYYIVETDDYDALCDAVKVLAQAEARIEIRPDATDE